MAAVVTAAAAVVVSMVVVAEEVSTVAVVPTVAAASTAVVATAEASMVVATQAVAAVVMAQAAGAEGWAATPHRDAASVPAVSADAVPAPDELGPSRVEATAAAWRHLEAQALPTETGTPSLALAARPDQLRAVDPQQAHRLAVVVK